MKALLDSKEEFCENAVTPTKWGLRVYTTGMCESVSAYVVEFVLHYGKFTTDRLVRPDLPFTSRIVLQLCNMLLSKVDESGYHIFTDRFYTSPRLCEDLRKMGFHLTGTVKVSRKKMPKNFSKRVGQKQNCVKLWLSEKMTTRWLCNGKTSGW